VNSERETRAVDAFAHFIIHRASATISSVSRQATQTVMEVPVSVMPIFVPSHLRFRSTHKQAVDENAMDDLLALARRIQNPNGEKAKLEIFKKHFASASGNSYAPSSSLSWAETDFWSYARDAAEDAPNFIAAFCDACEEIETLGGAVPDVGHINEVLGAYGSPFYVSEGRIVEAAPVVDSPHVILSPRDTVAKALADAAALVGQSGAASGIDRAHTALHGYLLDLCAKENIQVPSDASTTRVFKQLRENHPALQPEGHRASDITRILQSLSSVLDSLSPIRNKASLAHPNPLLEEAEAMVALNAARTIFRYIQDRLHRHQQGFTP